MFKTTYPNKVFDIMASGKPVICQIGGVIREVVEQYDAGIFVPPGDAQALADCVMKLSQNPARCEEMGRNGEAAIREHFNREEAERHLESIMLQMTMRS